MSGLGKLVKGYVFNGWTIEYPRGAQNKYIVRHPARPGAEFKFDFRSDAERFILKQPERY
jgi:hypothetical protein